MTSINVQLNEITPGTIAFAIQRACIHCTPMEHGVGTFLMTVFNDVACEIQETAGPFTPAKAAILHAKVTAKLKQCKKGALAANARRKNNNTHIQSHCE